jgi:hypothetical protein
MSEDVLSSLRRLGRLWTKPAAQQSRALVPWGGERVDVDIFYAQAWFELKQRQDALTERLKLANADWQVDQERGLIEFSRVDGALVRAPVQIIGSWNPNNETFSWGWDHPSVHPRLRLDAERTRWFGDAHALDDLTRHKVPANAAEAWRLAAVAMKVNAALGVYRAPTDGPTVFLTIGDPTTFEEPESK